jgi:hypothetical protein
MFVASSTYTSVYVCIQTYNLNLVVVAGYTRTLTNQGKNSFSHADRL